MKKALSMMMALAMLLALAACGNGDNKVQASPYIGKWNSTKASASGRY